MLHDTIAGGYSGPHRPAFGGSCRTSPTEPARFGTRVSLAETHEIPLALVASLTLGTRCGAPSQLAALDLLHTEGSAPMVNAGQLRGAIGVPLSPPITTSTRRFNWRPLASVLLATGKALP